MPIATAADFYKQLSKQLKAKKMTIYKLAKGMEFDRSNVRQMIDNKRDIQLSTFLAMVKAAGGTVNIEWQ